MKEDPGLYDYWPYDSRPKITWPNGARGAFWVAPNIEFYELDPAVNPHRAPWPKPVPDINGYATRDYGNRVGHMRMMRVLDKYGVRGSISLSTALCEHHPEIIKMCAERDWEFFSHGIYNTRYSYGMSEAQERAIIEDSIETVKRATGQRIRGWLAPALTHTPRTLDLLAEYDFTYTCDLYHDDAVQEVKVAQGQLASIPYSLEVNDHYGFNVYGMSGREYADALIKQFDRLADEGERMGAGTVMCIPLHAYLIGQPHRIGPFEEALSHIADDPRCWKARAGEIVDYWRAAQ